MIFRRVLAAFDGSAAADKAAGLAIRIAQEGQGRLRIVSVLETVSEDADLRTRRRLGAENAIAKVAASARQAGLDPETALVEPGVPFETILQQAATWGADLIVMGRTGRTGPGKSLLGSEAERVLEFAEVPVLIIPTTINRD
ncbi:MAG TPA: universal stress protein [Candidatus Dormibacteraeota bacterium]|nr:universal stress protein [Candidatus Dormibacteraeota bacterium]